MIHGLGVWQARKAREESVLEGTSIGSATIPSNLPATCKNCSSLRTQASKTCRSFKKYSPHFSILSGCSPPLLRERPTSISALWQAFCTRILSFWMNHKVWKLFALQMDSAASKADAAVADAVARLTAVEEKLRDSNRYVASQRLLTAL